jgi:hypothetical protein
MWYTPTESKPLWGPGKDPIQSFMLIQYSGKSMGAFLGLVVLQGNSVQHPPFADNVMWQLSANLPKHRTQNGRNSLFLKTPYSPSTNDKMFNDPWDFGPLKQFSYVGLPIVSRERAPMPAIQPSNLSNIVFLYPMVKAVRQVGQDSSLRIRNRTATTTTFW